MCDFIDWLIMHGIIYQLFYTIDILQMHSQGVHLLVSTAEEPSHTKQQCLACENCKFNYS